MLGALALTNEDNQGLAYLFGFLWGVGFGLYYSCEKAVYYYIVPAGQNAQYAGIAMFAGKILR